MANSKYAKQKGINRVKRKDVAEFESLISILIFLLLFAGISLFLLFFPRSTKSEIEKRKLAEFPQFTFESYFSGDFTAGIATFYDDTVPFRDSFKTAGYNFKSIYGIHTDEEVKVVGKSIKVVNPDGASKTDSEQQNSHVEKDNTSKPIETSDNNNVEQSSQVSEVSYKNNDGTVEADYSEENGIIVIKHNGHYRALELFGGGRGDVYAEALNAFHEQLGDSVKIYSVTAPLSSEYYTPESYLQFTLSQKDCIENIASKLDDGIKYVDIHTPLLNHSSEDIYLRTDHHWTALGAYYAAESLAKAAGVPFKDLSTFTKKDINGFVGTMYAFTQDANINNDPETFSYYVPDNYDKCVTEYYTTSFDSNGTDDFFNTVGDPQHNAYLTFMGDDEKIVKVKTNVKNGRKLMIVKDSYGNAIPGYLFNSFEEIYVIDMRYCNVNLISMIKENNITDLAFTMVIFSAVGRNSENLEVLRTQ